MSAVHIAKALDIIKDLDESRKALGAEYGRQ
jgi:hypothetical protein